MKQLLAITMFLTLGASAVAAAPMLCNLPFAASTAEAKLFATAAGCGGGGGGGGGAVCPVAIPVPANAFACQCKTTTKDPAQRCQGALPPDVCTQQIQTALGLGLLTSDAVTYLESAGFCPVVPPGFNQIIDFCPRGCFAGDTEILTGVTGNALNSYLPASRLVPQDPVLALSDEASLDGIDLVSRSLDRVVYGPEEPLLFAFGLATGATLRVTAHHPMVLADGTIVEAAAVPPGTSFIGVDGELVAVMSITREPATTDVFNVQTDSDTQLGHLIIGNGVVFGDLKLQNDLATEQSLIDVRR